MKKGTQKRGVPKITDVYGREAFEFRENSIVVTIPFNKIDSETVDKVIDKSRGGLSEVSIRIMEEMRHNPGITQPQLAESATGGKVKIWMFHRFNSRSASSTSE